MAKERIDGDIKKSTGIGIRLSSGEKEKVNYICSKNELDISDMIRMLINNEYYRLANDDK